MLSDKDVVVREKIRKLLESNVVEVRFTKKDGTRRDMICTLDPTYLPKNSAQSAEEKENGRSNEALAVWDLQKKGWRSFRIDSIDSYLARRAQASW